MSNYGNEQDTECFVLVITSMYVILMYERFYTYERVLHWLLLYRTIAIGVFTNKWYIISFQTIFIFIVVLILGQLLVFTWIC